MQNNQMLVAATQSVAQKNDKKISQRVRLLVKTMLDQNNKKYMMKILEKRWHSHAVLKLYNGKNIKKRYRKMIGREELRILSHEITSSDQSSSYFETHLLYCHCGLSLISEFISCLQTFLCAGDHQYRDR